MSEMKLEKTLRDDMLRWDDNSTKHISNRSFGTAFDVLKDMLDDEELRIHTLRRRGYTAKEICMELNMSLEYYTTQHNNIEDKSNRMLPVPDIPSDNCEETL